MTKKKLTLKLRRIREFGETTLGVLSIVGIERTWFILEPGGPDSTKENSDKRIFPGRYSLRRFNGEKFKNVYELIDVPGRSYILMHSGFSHKNTEGCLLPGKKWGILKDGNYCIYYSNEAKNEIFLELSKHSNIEIEISNCFSFSN